jgi:hypothetical protein
MTSILNKEKKNRNIKLSQQEKEQLANKIEQYGTYILLFGIILSLIFLR